MPPRRRGDAARAGTPALRRRRPRGAATTPLATPRTTAARNVSTPIAPDGASVSTASTTRPSPRAAPPTAGTALSPSTRIAYSGGATPPPVEVRDLVLTLAVEQHATADRGREREDEPERSEHRDRRAHRGDSVASQRQRAVEQRGCLAPVDTVEGRGSSPTAWLANLALIVAKRRSTDFAFVSVNPRGSRPSSYRRATIRIVSERQELGPRHQHERGRRRGVGIPRADVADEVLPVRIAEVGVERAVDPSHAKHLLGHGLPRWEVMNEAQPIAGLETGRAGGRVRDPHAGAWVRRELVDVRDRSLPPHRHDGERPRLGADDVRIGAVRDDRRSKRRQRLSQRRHSGRNTGARRRHRPYLEAGGERAHRVDLPLERLALDRRAQHRNGGRRKRREDGDRRDREEGRRMTDERKWDARPQTGHHRNLE